MKRITCWSASFFPPKLHNHSFIKLLIVEAALGGLASSVDVRQYCGLLHLQAVPHTFTFQVCPKSLTLDLPSYPVPSSVQSGERSYVRVSPVLGSLSEGLQSCFAREQYSTSCADATADTMRKENRRMIFEKQKNVSFFFIIFTLS